MGNPSVGNPSALLAVRRCLATRASCLLDLVESAAAAFLHGRDFCSADVDYEEEPPVRAEEQAESGAHGSYRMRNADDRWRDLPLPEAAPLSPRASRSLAPPALQAEPEQRVAYGTAPPRCCDAPPLLCCGAAPPVEDEEAEERQNLMAQLRQVHPPAIFLSHPLARSCSTPAWRGGGEDGAKGRWGAR